MCPDRSDSSSDANQVWIRGGTVGSVGGLRVGVIGVDQGPKGSAVGAPVITVAALSIDDHQGTVPAEMNLAVHAGDVLPLADGLHRVLHVSPESSCDPRGAVAIAASPNAASKPLALDSSTLYLFENGRLRLVGSDRDHTYDVRVLEWHLDRQTSRRVVAEWLPARYAREDTNPRDIHRVEFGVDDHVVIGKSSLEVLAIDPPASDHSAWVRFSAHAR